MGTGDFNGSCSDAMTLLISDWVFYFEGGKYSARSRQFPIATEVIIGVSRL